MVQLNQQKKGSVKIMPVTVNILYSGTGTNAQDFANEMMSTGVVSQIRQESGNLRYNYFTDMEDNQSILLIDEWTDQAAIDSHHKSDMMTTIAELRIKYHLKMQVTRYVRDEK